MKIVVSGGWGYGNLGDDAILMSTCRLLLEAFKGCSLTVFTYEIDQILARSNSDIVFVNSCHHYIDKNSAFGFYRPLTRPLSKATLVRHKLRHLFLEKSEFFRKKALDGVPESVAQVIRSADLFVLGGGGYLNEDWVANCQSHFDEVRVAVESKVPYVVCGPGMGKFSNARLRDQMESLCRRAAAVWVRDEFSAADISKFNSSTSVIPDIALSDFSINERPRSGWIGVIVNRLDESLFANLIVALDAVVRDRKMSLKLLLSRRWIGDFRATLRLSALLQNMGIPAKIVLPSSFEELNDEIECCDLVISENLHGLILSVRRGVPVIAVNNYNSDSPNGRKFIAFMRQIDSEEFVFKSDTPSGVMTATIFSGLDKILEKRQMYKEFCTNVRAEGLGFLRQHALEV